MKTTDKVQTENTTSTSTTSSQWQTYNHYNAEQGWECPRCGRINAPWVRQCDCNRSHYTITWTGNDNYYDEWWKYVKCDTDTFKVHPDEITWTGGSDYWDPSSHSYVNMPTCGTNTIHNGKTNYKEK